MKTSKLTKSIIALAAIVALGAALLQAQVASPMQAGHYVPGIMNVRDMATPPDGLFVIWYNWGLWSDSFIDRDGNKLSRLNLSEVDPGYPDLDVKLDVSAFATVPVVFWAKGTSILGGLEKFLIFSTLRCRFCLSALF